eukprot:TRINITY_DN5452_c3_g1_i1.p1 TRINITY_DN5452_c3_g1~~TRINITY_DN5452_c3_g1_i1.p1  ORF type:complete len:1108 (+),score=301.27 TRINITY_DN5452_c3_g1_i1:118-3441(+)
MAVGPQPIDADLAVLRAGPGQEAEEQGGWEVYLHVYDLTKGWMKRLSRTLFGRQVDGLYHTGVVVYGREYFFEGGITSVPQGRTRFGKPGDEHNQRRRLGRTQFSQEEFEVWVRHQERTKYSRLEYHLVDKNCNHFSEDAVQFLLGIELCEDVRELPSLVHTSAIGRLFSATIDIFFGGWQWIMLVNQWRSRRRLDRQWADWSLERGPAAADAPEQPRRPSARLVQCQAAPPDARWVSNAEREGMAPPAVRSWARRRVAVKGRPPPRYYLFIPRREGHSIPQRLRAALATAELEEAGHSAGLDAVCTRLTRLLACAEPDIAAAAASPSGGTSGWVLPTSEECAVFVWVLRPIVAKWRAHVFGPDGGGAKHRSQTTALRRAVEQSLPTLLAVLDALSVLSLSADYARMLLHPYRGMIGAKSSGGMSGPSDPRSELRSLLVAEEGITGISTDCYEHVPPAVQVLMLRTFCNIFGAGNGLARLCAVAMSRMWDGGGTVYNVGWLARKATVMGKGAVLLRLTASSLLCNVMSMLNTLHATIPVVDVPLASEDSSDDSSTSTPAHAPTPRLSPSPRRGSARQRPPTPGLPRVAVGDTVHLTDSAVQRMLDRGWDFLTAEQALQLGESGVVLSMRNAANGQYAMVESAIDGSTVRSEYPAADLTATGQGTAADAPAAGGGGEGPETLAVGMWVEAHSLQNNVELNERRGRIVARTKAGRWRVLFDGIGYKALMSSNMRPIELPRLLADVSAVATLCCVAIAFESCYQVRPHHHRQKGNADEIFSSPVSSHAADECVGVTTTDTADVTNTPSPCSATLVLDLQRSRQAPVAASEGEPPRHCLSPPARRSPRLSPSSRLRLSGLSRDELQAELLQLRVLHADGAISETEYELAVAAVRQRADAPPYPEPPPSPPPARSAAAAAPAGRARARASSPRPSKAASAGARAPRSRSPSPSAALSLVNQRSLIKQLVDLRLRIVRSVCRRLPLERDVAVVQRLLGALYHACLPCDADAPGSTSRSPGNVARWEMVRIPALNIPYIKRAPSMEVRYMARLVEFMARSSGPPPDAMHLSMPRRPPRCRPVPYDPGVAHAEDAGRQVSPRRSPRRSPIAREPY